MPQLPTPSPLAVGKVTIDDQAYVYHSLSRAQALRIKTFAGREAEAEAYMIACATDVSEDEAMAWLEAVDTDKGSLLIDGIVEISGLDPQAGSTRGRRSRRSSSEP